MRSLILLLLALSVASLAACVERVEPAGIGKGALRRSTKDVPKKNTTGDDDDDDDDAPKAAPSGATTTTTSAGPAPVLEVPDAGPPPKDPFANAPSFTLVTTATQSEEHHLGESNANKDCMSCHTGSGAPKFAIGGTVFRTKAGTEPAAGVQVRVIDPNGTELALAGSDASGNFWLVSPTPIPAGSRVGIRDATGTMKMSGAIGTGSCNQSNCHGKERPIFLAP